eukprot:GILI01022461.1.p1 GENE.GILI01022461.1~~GILI01022461.1.p1  ORF type:complete len:191 (-),score=58.38 GILI01022461.1:129-701(-)
MTSTDIFATKEFADDYVSPRKIPRVIFIDNVAEVIKARGITPETMLRQMQEQLSKYRLMDTKLTQSKSMLNAKIPEILKTMDTVKFLKQKLNDEAEAIETSFGLTDSVFCTAKCKAQKTVHLWLGANVMCEYSHEEAIEMLDTNLVAAKANLANTLEDLAWLKDQQTILEVNVARVYNFDVESRRTTATA